jgi:excisionase family DNA binding protein
MDRQMAMIPNSIRYQQESSWWQPTQQRRPRFYTVKEVCFDLRLGEQTIRDKIASGEIENVVKIGNSLRIPAEEVEKLLKPRRPSEQDELRGAALAKSKAKLAKEVNGNGRNE